MAQDLYNPNIAPDEVQKGKCENETYYRIPVESMCEACENNPKTCGKQPLECWYK